MWRSHFQSGMVRPRCNFRRGSAKDLGFVVLVLLNVEEPFPIRDGTTSVQLQERKRQRSEFRSVRFKKDSGFVVSGSLDVEEPFLIRDGTTSVQLQERKRQKYEFSSVRFTKC